MTAPARARCAADDLWGNRRQCVGRWYLLTDPDGRTFGLCSTACLPAYAVLGVLPADLGDTSTRVGAREDEAAA